jgi:hypothetical protein
MNIVAGERHGLRENYSFIRSILQNLMARNITLEKKKRMRVVGSIK